MRRARARAPHGCARRRATRRRQAVFAKQYNPLEWELWYKFREDHRLAAGVRSPTPANPAGIPNHGARAPRVAQPLWSRAYTDYDELKPGETREHTELSHAQLAMQARRDYLVIATW